MSISKWINEGVLGDLDPELGLHLLLEVDLLVHALEDLSHLLHEGDGLLLGADEVGLDAHPGDPGGLALRAPEVEGDGAAGLRLPCGLADSAVRGKGLHEHELHGKDGRHDHKKVAVVLLGLTESETKLEKLWKCLRFAVL